MYEQVSAISNRFDTFTNVFEYHAEVQLKKFLKENYNINRKLQVSRYIHITHVY